MSKSTRFQAINFGRKCESCGCSIRKGAFVYLRSGEQLCKECNAAVSK